MANEIQSIGSLRRTTYWGYW